VKTIIVTGGGSGIGASTVDLLLENPNTRVAVFDREVSASPDERVMAVEVDVTNRDLVKSAVEKVAAWGGGVDGLVCCAGIQRFAPSEDIDEAIWNDVLRIHLDGSLWVSQFAAKEMENGGAIVLFSSIAGRFGWPKRLPYAVSKAGIEAMARTLAVEWADRGIRVNAIAPGYVATPMVQNQIDAGGLDGEVLAGFHALNRIARPDEIARAARFLLSEDSTFITGETLYVDGGFSIKKVIPN
jgi:NAD(P)-dependent dehydrogenase (short-subunit alcohol dehydrogenase family)